MFLASVNDVSFFQVIKTVGDRTQHPLGFCACVKWQCHPGLSTDELSTAKALHAWAVIHPSWKMSCRVQINHPSSSVRPQGSKGWTDPHLPVLQSYSPALSGCHVRHWWLLGPPHVKSISQMHTLEEEKEECKKSYVTTIKVHLAEYPLLRTGP